VYTDAVPEQCTVVVLPEDAPPAGVTVPTSVGLPEVASITMPHLLISRLIGSHPLRPEERGNDICHDGK
jgi:hypothetical protein